MLNIPQQKIDAATRHEKAGRFDEAELCYRQYLEEVPESHSAMFLLGILGIRTERREMALEYFRRAIAMNPSVSMYHYICLPKRWWKLDA
jgi:tetratricopeptide (TPR) repeat protein